MYKVLHFITGSAYADDFIKFVNKNYTSKTDITHKIYVISNHERLSLLPSDKNRFEFYDFDSSGSDERKLLHWLIDGEESRTVKEAEEYDRIVIHGLFHPALMILLRLHPKILKRTYIVLWGGDFYCHCAAVKRGAPLEQRVEEGLRHFIYKRVPVLAMDMPTDFPLICEWYGVSDKRTRIVYLTYPQLVDSKSLRIAEENICCKQEYSANKELNIQLGNSATDTNQHISALHLLSKYKDENIKLFCPLSYGDTSYADEVEAEGSRIFGDKFVSIRQAMNPEEYCSFLSKMDVAVFNNNRQQGMANIALLAYLGTKVFIRNDTSMWDQYVIKDGCSFTSVDEITEMTFDEFRYYENNDYKKTSAVFAYMWNNDSMIKLWKPILEP